MERQQLVTRTFVDLADTLVQGYDLIEFLHFLATRCTELLGVTDAGIVLAIDGHLQVLASSSERMHLVELLEVDRGDGPCLDAWRTGEPARAHRLDDAGETWPEFAPAAMRAGFRSVYAVPMRLRQERIGALNLFATHAEALAEEDEALAQALADIATVGILHERYLRQRDLLVDQLQTALDSRITLEQAKGILAERGGQTVDEAFQAIRGHARNTNTPLSEVARGIIDGTTVLPVAGVAPTG